MRKQGRAALMQARVLYVIVSFIDDDDAAALLDAESSFTRVRYPVPHHLPSIHPAMRLRS
jgi:hypothetical protein